MAKESASKGPSRSSQTQVNALCKSGVVLLSSHIEGYIEELGRDAITSIVDKGITKNEIPRAFRYYLSRDIIRRVRDSQSPDTISSAVIALFERDSHIWDRTTKFSSSLSFDAFVGSLGNPSHKRIKKFLRRFGFENFEYELKKTLKAKYLPVINMMQQVITQRNRIAHGDYSTTGAPSDLETMIELSVLYCSTTDEIACTWFGSIGIDIKYRDTYPPLPCGTVPRG